MAKGQIQKRKQKAGRRGKRVKIDCQSCNGRGRVEVPQLAEVTMSQLARTAGRSRSLVSRMLSDDVAAEQKRFNPILATMVAICDAVKAETGAALSLDALARVIRG